MRSLLPLLALLTVATRAAGASYLPLDEERLAGASDMIVAGTVTSVQSVERPDGRIVTDTVIDVERTLKGRPHPTVIVTTPGGSVGGRTVRVYDVPDFRVGERMLVFLQRTAAHELRPAAFALGVFHLTAAGTGGLIAERRQPFPAQLPLERLAAIARDGATASHRLAPALRPPPVPVGIDELFRFFDPPVRWAEPDRGQPVIYGLANADPSIGFADAEARAALRAWTQVTGASIVLELGTGSPGRSAVSGTCDGRSTIQLNDPFDEIPPLIDCGGVVAIGGFCLGSGTSLAGPTVCRDIAEGDLTVNDHIGGCIDRTTLAEILTHEVGHTIGLAHSSQDPNEPNFNLRDATMYFLLHGDGRGASLRADDIAGVSALYPIKPDGDGDGVVDEIDVCPETPAGRVVDATGCACGEAGHVPCDDGLLCTDDACDEATAACVAPPIDCTGGDTCLRGRCDPTTGCSTTPVEGTEAMTCAFARRFPPATCRPDHVPRPARRLFHQAGRLVRRAVANAARREALLARAGVALDGVHAVVERAASRARRPLGADCVAAIEALVADARARAGIGGP